MGNLKQHLHEVIYEADTKEGKLFDVVLLILIALSIILVMLESVTSINKSYSTFFNYSEWVITILFSIEYILRILVVKKSFKYIFSFYGIIDFLAILPKYLSLFLIGSHVFISLRALRLLRVFRILKLAHYTGASNQLADAIKNSRAKIAVFLYVVLIISVIFGTLMYVIEGEENGFTSIPRGIYWCIVTLTTVGFGDIAPTTSIGQFIATIIMILGYGIIAVPTGIVTAEMSKTNPKGKKLNTQHCINCNASNHKSSAKYCYNCGENLNND